MVGVSCDKERRAKATAMLHKHVAAVVKRRRCAVVDAWFLTKTSLGPTGPKRHKLAVRRDWFEHVRREGDRMFRRIYRLDVQSFNELLEMIRNRISTLDSDRAVQSSGSEVCAELRLAMTLRYLAGGSATDIRLIFGVSYAEFYKSLWTVIDAINAELGISFPIDNPDKLAAVEMKFASKSRHQTVRGAVGAIDGCIIAMRNPGLAVHNPRRYYCTRKSKYALLLMAIADADRKFLWFDVSCTPTTHDSLAWSRTALAHRIKNGDLPRPYFLLGDSAFVCTRSMISPGRDDNFNFEQSSMRMSVECSFGELVRRWGVLWRPLEMAFVKRAAVVGCCLQLHNFCVDRRLQLERSLRYDNGELEVQPGRRRTAPVVDKNGIPVDILSSACSPNCHCTFCVAGRSNTATKDTSRREELELACRNAGIVRPATRPPRR